MQTKNLTPNQNPSVASDKPTEEESAENQESKALVNGYSKFGNYLFFGTIILNGALGMQDMPFIIGIGTSLVLTSARQVGTQRSAIMFLIMLALGTGYFVMTSETEDKTGLLVSLIMESEEQKKQKKEAKEKEKADRENRK